MTYQRDAAEPAAGDRVVYWGSITEPDGRVHVSPNFMREHMLLDWLERHDGDDTVAYGARRVIRESGAFDTPLFAPPPAADHERLDTLVDGARGALTAGRRAQAGTGRQEPSTEPVESEFDRERVTRTMGDTRRQRDSERKLRENDATLAMLAYDDIYDVHGRPTPEAVDAVNSQRAAHGQLPLAPTPRDEDAR